MATRFRKTVTLIPGIRMNISKSGVSYSFGPRGSTVSFGKRGTYVNVGIPGTGLSKRMRLDSPAPRRRAAATRKTVKEQEIDHRGELPMLNKDYEEIINIHARTKGPMERPTFQPKKFPVPKPKNSVLAAYPRNHIVIGAFIIFSAVVLLGALLSISSEVAGAFLILVYTGIYFGYKYNNRLNYQDALESWEEAKEEFEQKQKRLQAIFRLPPSAVLDYCEELLDGILSDLDWPRETLVSYEMVCDDAVMLDVDLPEIEDMPMASWTTNDKGTRLIKNEHSETKVRKDYMTHIHGVGCFLVGEVFRTLTNIEKVVVSGFSQRIDRSSGALLDVYLYSVAIAREDWKKVNFSRIAQIDPVELLGSFEMRRNMTKTGIFKPVEPFEQIGL